MLNDENNFDTMTRGLLTDPESGQGLLSGVELPDSTGESEYTSQDAADDILEEVNR